MPTIEDLKCVVEEEDDTPCCSIEEVKSSEECEEADGRGLRTYGPRYVRTRLPRVDGQTHAAARKVEKKVAKCAAVSRI